jgi:hypothetical protein
MTLTDAQKTDVRRFCGYQMAGNLSSFTSWRFFQPYAQMEFRLNNATDSEYAVIVNYLTQLTALESDIITAADNLGTDQAAVWHRNKSEISDRTKLFNNWRRRLCGFLGVSPGPDLESSNNIRLVV